MKRTAFIFGRTPQLSFLELQSFYPKATSPAEGVGMVESAVDADAVVHLLGGTVKIVDVQSEAAELSTELFFSALLPYAKSGHITFGISAYGRAYVSNTQLAVLKKEFTQRGVSARYIETKHHEALSSVVIAKQEVVELVVIGLPGTNLIGVTLAVQDFEDWNKRDFGRPAPDAKAGMLPPKVARMIVNIALPHGVSDHHPMVLDPFCGVGTVLGEALLRGANVTGSDLSEAAVANSKKNLEWLRREYPVVAPLYMSVMVADATHVSEFLTPQSVDAIVTEPYMGETVEAKDIAKLTPERVKNILKGLEKLYIGALKEWANILKPQARIVMAMPAYDTGRGVLRVKKVVDRCESLGYTLLTEPIEYGRPKAIVRREFYIFQKG
ncbi:hypothetical protein KJZ67_04625 [Patescibacteria group bacterium]|nr:hypothetical protein [Patescibacteria group bacterium]